VEILFAIAQLLCRSYPGENRKFVHPIIVYSQISSDLSKPDYRLLKTSF